MRFLTDAWEPIEFTAEQSKLSGKMFSGLQPRHYAILISGIMLLLAPLSWMVTRDVAVPVIFVGFSMLTASVTVIVAGRGAEKTQ
jgi:hypothetical protein